MKTKRIAGLIIAGFLGLLTVAPVVWAQDADNTPTAPTVEERIAKQLERMTTRLDLTEQQQVDIEAVLKANLTELETVMAQVKALHEKMQSEVDALLTEEQLAKKPDFQRGPRGPFAGPRPDGPVGRGRGGRGGRGPGFGAGFGPGAAGPRGALGQLDLTDEQKTQIREIMQSRPEDPKAAVAEVLTDEQKTKLDELCNAEDRPFGLQGPRMGRGGFGGRGMGRPGGPGAGLGVGFRGLLRDLDLTTEQRTQIHEIMQDRPEDPIEAIKGVLTEEQLQKLEELKADNTQPVQPGKVQRPNSNNGRPRRGGIHVIGG